MTNTFIVDSVGGISGSLTQLVDGTSYLIAGPGMSILSQSNGSIVLDASATVSNINVSGSNLSFYGASPVAQPAAAGTLATFGSDLINVAEVSGDVQANFTTIKNEINAMINILNAINNILSQAAGGNGISQ